MARASAVVVLLFVVVLAVYATGCAKKEPPMPGPVTGPIEPLPDEPLGATPAATGEYTYVCPEHADQTSDEPEKCPVCEEYMKADTEEEVEYYCPDHPEIVQDEPGEHEGVFLKARPKAAATDEPAVEEEPGLEEDASKEDTSADEPDPAGAPTEI
jgi:hypothetical protein